MARKMSEVKADQEYYKDIQDRTEPTVHGVDGNNWGCRAYFAVMGQNKKDSKGRQVAGIANFCSMVKAHINAVHRNAGDNEQFHVFGFDPNSKDTWRYKMQAQWVKENKVLADELFATKLTPMYKGNRDRGKYPDLGWQVSKMHEIMIANGFCTLQKAPYECDDVLGAISVRFCPKAFVDLYTVDKDYMQLVKPRVRLIMPEQANRSYKIFTEHNAHELFGVNADQMVDFLAMSGDSADNVLGLIGVGEGTAVKLLKEWGSLQNLIDNIDTVKGKSRWIKILKGEEPSFPIEMQVEMVTIDRIVPKLPRKLKELRRKEPDIKAIRKLNKELGFNVEIKLSADK